jgi:stearoyl-CoA desaturase (Delta-9 desaturase)
MTTRPAEKINWTNTLFLTLCPLAAIVGTVLLCIYSSIGWQTWVLFAVFTFLTGLAITSGYHRLFSHKTYQTRAPIRLIYLLFGAAAFEGSVLEWCSDHRIHHRHADTEKDPYNINRGFWYAHMGWLIRLDVSKRDFSNVADLEADPLCRFQHRFFVPLAILMGFVMPMAIAGFFWGAPLGGLIVAGALRISLNHHFTFFINSLCHTMGKRPYTEEQTARDHWVAAIFTYGEGYHNYHHKFPIDYRNGVRAYQYDPAKWLIWSLSKVGLAYNLKRVSSQRIARYILQAQKLEEKAQGASAREMILQTKERVLGVIQQLESLEKEYSESLKAATCKETIKSCRSKLRKVRRELSTGMASWSKLVKQYA